MSLNLSPNLSLGTGGATVVVPPPVNTVAPAISGTPSPGNVLTCSTGTWTNVPTGYTYQWKRNGTDRSGETASTYTAVAGDVGTNLTCVVTASNASGAGTPVSTANFPLYDTDAQAYFAAVVSNGGAALTAATKAAFNTCVVGLKTDTVWTSLDRLAWFGNETSTAALTDIRNPAKLWQASGSPGFSALNGYTGDGLGAYVSAIDNISDGPLFTQNSASHGIIVNKANGAGSQVQSGTVASVNESMTTATTVSFSVRVNAGTGTPSAGAALRTCYGSGTRTDAGNIQSWQNPTTTTPTATSATASSAVPASPYTVLRRTTTYSPDRVLMAFYGAVLTGAQQVALYARCLTLASALGNPLS